jgi:diguanylate cyclase (GGDEF)-like protein/PAS domain S-box-containing protein
MKKKLVASKEENKKRNEAESLTKAGSDELLTKIASAAPVAIYKFRLDSDGKMSMPYSTQAIFNIYGMTPAKISEDFDSSFQMNHDEDKKNLLSAIEKSKQTMQPFQCEWRVNNPDKGEIWVSCRSTPEVEPDGAIAWYGYFHDITELKKVEQRRQSHVYFFESLDQINRAIQGSSDLEQMMSDVLDLVLSIFDCDRAWLLYPCDPDAEFISIPMERTKPEYPGANTKGLELKMEPDIANSLRLYLNNDKPVACGPGTENPFLPDKVIEYKVKSYVAMALYPKLGKPWAFGIHQCSHVQIWTEDNINLFREIGRRLSDGLTSLLVSRNLQESEEHFRQAFEFAGIGMAILSLNGTLLRVNHSLCEMLGYNKEQLEQTNHLELCHPADVTFAQDDEQRLISGEITYKQIEKRYRHNNGHYLWVKLTITLLRSSKGKPQSFVYQIENIDQRKQAENENTLLSFALNHVKEAAYLIDENALFHYVNDEVCRKLGYSREELLRMSVPDVGLEFPMEIWREHWRELIDKGSVMLEAMHQTKTGEVFPVEINANYFEYDGRGYNLALVRDIAKRKRAEQDISLLNFAINHIHESVYLLNKDGGFEYVNDKACQSFGYSRDELLELGVADIHTDFQVSLWRQHWEDIKQHGSVILETIHKTKDGSFYPVEINANYFEYDGRSYNLALERNIADRKHAEEVLQRSEVELQLALDAGHLGDWKWDIVNDEITWSSRCKVIYGLSPDAEITYDRFLEIIHPDDRDEVERILNEAVETGNDYEMEKRIILPDGTVRWTIGRGRVTHNDNGEPVLMAGITIDITERKEQDERIQYLAYHDALTGLPNRELVLNLLNQAMAQAQRHNKILAVLFLDLDRFKDVNDTLGHLAGDTLLKKAAVCLAEGLREEDTIGRVGGDEFLILLPELASPQDAAHVTGKIIESLSTPFTVAGHELHINASIGISLYPRDSKEVETLVKYADSALYLAKEQGRNTFRFFSPELDARVRDRLHMENDLRCAIERKELFVHYQPQIEQSSGRYIGAEALLRWQHPIHGLVSPANFIPIAEDTGLIISIGEWVIRKACTQAREWEKQGHTDFIVSINLSKRQLEENNFIDRFSEILKETRCKSRLIEFEITESSAMSEPEEAIAKLRTLHEMGVQLAIDDFGTGYSSLTYLKRFPFDRLKIDQSFVAGIPDDDDDDIAITKITIMLAHQLRMRVIAEGVETEAQREFLKENGCDEMQGYLFGKPMLPDDLNKIITS